METVSKQEAAAEKAAEREQAQRVSAGDLVGDGVAIPESKEEHDSWTPAQEKAMNGGWKPNKDEWEGDPDEWVDAPEFNRRGELMSRISQLGRKLGDSEKLIEKLTAMVNANEEVTQKMINREVADAEKRLKAQRREAIRDGDFEAVDGIEEDLEELKETKVEVKEEKKAPAPQGPDISEMSPHQRVWYDLVTSTPWIQQDRAVHDPLLKFAEAWLNDNEGESTMDFTAAVVDKAGELRRGEKPQKRGKLGGPDDGKSGTRQGGRAPKKGGKFGASDLNAQQKAIANEFMEQGIIDSLEEYANMMGKEGHLDSQR